MSQVAQHQPRLVERADEVLARLEVHADFAADGAVHLREQRGRHLHERQAAQVGRRHETRQIAHHAAAERDDEGLAFQPLRGQLVVARLDGLQALGGFARGDGDQRGSEAGFRQGLLRGFAITGARRWCRR